MFLFSKETVQLTLLAYFINRLRLVFTSVSVNIIFINSKIRDNETKCNCVFWSTVYNKLAVVKSFIVIIK